MSEVITVSGNELELQEESFPRIPAGLQTPDPEGEEFPQEQQLSYEAVYAAVYDAVMASESAEMVTDGQMVNSTALSYFEGILSNQKLPVDYVVYTGESYSYYNNGYERTAYEYCMVYGDLELSGNTFTGEDLTVVRMRTSGNVSVNYEYGQSITLDAPMYYSRSNMGDYSGIIQYDLSGFMLLVLAVFGGVIWFISKIMCLRR